MKLSIEFIERSNKSIDSNKLKIDKLLDDIPKSTARKLDPPEFVEKRKDMISAVVTEGEYSEKCVKLSLTTTQNDEHDQDQNNQRERSQWL